MWHPSNYGFSMEEEHYNRNFKLRVAKTNCCAMDTMIIYILNAESALG